MFIFKKNTDLIFLIIFYLYILFQDQESLQANSKRENELRKRELKALKEKIAQENEVCHKSNGLKTIFLFN